MEIPAVLLGQQTAMARAAALVLRRMRMAQMDAKVFVEMVCRDDHGNALELAPLHRQWFRHIDYCWERRLRALILGPFGSGKTSTLCVPLISWMVGRDPNIRIKVLTNDDASASKRVQACKRILISPAYRQVFPEVQQGDRWTDHELYVRRFGQSPEPSVHARGIFTTGIGGRADRLLFDDVVDQKNSTDPAQRKRVIDLVEQTWLSRLEPDGRVLSIGTAWHSADLYHQLMHRKGWCTLIQRVADDCMSIEQEVLGATDGHYPTSG